MLTVTENAVTEIRNLTQSTEVPAGTGVRIASDTGNGGLTLSLAATPAEDDTVVDASGARVFLDAAASSLLADKALDAVADQSGQVQFAVADQA